LIVVIRFMTLDAFFDAVVIPAYAGIESPFCVWIPAFAGMTNFDFTRRL